jgi:deazaflavin-dependent oxidoreductase (nitroreductase family)
VRIPPVDPMSHPQAKRVIEPIALSRVGTWYVKRIAPSLDLALDRLTGGRLASLPVVSVVLLKHRGARSGLPRVTPLIYFTDGDDVVLMASNYGGPRHPAWYHNVKAHPEVRLRARGREGPYLARVATGAEHERLWAMAKRFTRVYADYERRADGRAIQVVVCSPLDPA